MKAEGGRQKEEGIPLGDWTDDKIDRSGPDGEGDFIYVDISSIDRASKRIIEPKEMPVEKAPSRAKQVLRQGDVLVSMTRPNLNAVAQVPAHLDGSIGSTGFHVLRPKHADSGFLFYAVQSREFIEAMSMKVQGALYPAVRPNDISAFCLPPFALARQRRIVAKIEELFSELDAGEAALKKARHQLGVYRQSLLKQAFEGKLTAPWRAQHPDLLESPDQLLARIQAERQDRYEQQLKEWEAALQAWESAGEGGKKPPKPKLATPNHRPPSSADLPSEWVWTNLGILKQFSLYGPRFSSDDYSDDGVCVLRTSDIGESGKVNLATAPRLRLNKAEQYQYGCQKGDLLITRTGSLGTLAVFNDDVDSIPGAYLIQYRLVAAQYAPFIYHFLRGPVGQSALTGGGAGVGRPNLNAPTIEAIPIPLCSLPEQHEIVRLLDEQFEVIEQNEREIDTALKRSEALRQSILKKAFTGQLVPQDPTDEPASTLLARIQAERDAAPNPPKKTATRRKPR